MKQERVPALQHEAGFFTELRVGDLREVHVALDPYVSVLALVTDALGRRRGAPEAWRKRVVSALSPSSARAVLPIAAPRYSVSPDCVTPHNPVREVPVSDQLDWLHSIPDDELLGDIDAVFGEPPPHWQAALRRPRTWLHSYADAIGEVWQCVQPLWSQAQPLLDREVRRVGAAAVRGRLELILDRLHPASRLEGNVLKIRDPEPASFDLGARPLVLVPMLSGHQALICNLERSDAVWIGYPLPGASQLPYTAVDGHPGHAGHAGHAGHPGHAGHADSLDLLLGAVRTRLLRAVARPRTMTALAAVADLPPSAITHHCGRLVAAGLVRRDKRGREVWVSRTVRGSALIDLYR
jgi:DNA-binding transcriptional ArsR family regulator